MGEFPLSPGGYMPFWFSALPNRGGAEMHGKPKGHKGGVFYPCGKGDGRNEECTLEGRRTWQDRYGPGVWTGREGGKSLSLTTPRCAALRGLPIHRPAQCSKRRQMQAPEMAGKEGEGHALKGRKMPSPCRAMAVSFFPFARTFACFLLLYRRSPAQGAQ